jgi:competence protein ComEC
MLLPLLSATLISGYLIVFLSIFLNLHPTILNIYESWLWIFNNSVEWLGGIDELIFKDVYFPPAFCFFSFLALGILTIGIINGKKQVTYGFAGCLIVMQLFWIHQRAELIQSEELVVFQQYGSNLMLKRKGSVFEFNNRGGLSEKQDQIVAQYESELPGAFSYRFDEQESPSDIQVDLVNESLVCILNQDIEIEEFNLKPDILIFSDAPRMNLNRILGRLRPKIVVADGSNPPGFVKRCRSTCEALGIDFHSTLAQGAFQYPK